MTNLNQYINELTSSIAQDLDYRKLKSNCESIISKYRNIESQGSDYEIKTLEEALSYLVYRMPATSMVIDEVLNKLLEEVEGYNPKSILDIGSGTGASVVPLAYNFNDFSLTTIEEQDVMNKAFDVFIDKVTNNETFNPMENINYTEKFKKSILNYDGTSFDLVLLSYVINEFKDEELRLLANKLISIVNDFVVIIVPGTPKFFKNLEYLKSLLLEKGFNIIAPCPKSRTCHLDESNWCHFYKRVERSSILRRLKGADLSYEDEKFSYVIMSKKEFIERPKEEASFYRILRHPINSKGNIEMELCTGDTVDLRKFTKKKDKEIYKDIKKLKWGDKIYIE